NADGTPNYGTVTLGNGAGPTQVKNVADATDDHDALNLGQLKDTGLVGDDGAGNLTSLAVTYDGAAKDSVTLGGMGATAPVAIHNVADGVLAADSKDAVNGSQLFATNTRVGDLEDSLGKGGVIDPVTGESLAVVYDSNTKDTVTLAGASGTTLSNVKAGVADMDAVNVSQLKGSGLIGDDGKSIAAVTYDRNADGTPNYGTVTLGNGAGPTQVKNVADATDDHDALNLGQLKDAGLVGDDGAGNLTSMAVTYDGSARDKVTLAGVDGTTLSNVKAGVADMDAVNVSQLKGSGLIGDDGKSIAAVTYDRNADGTPNYGTVTLGNGAGPTQVKNVADATDDHDALNLGQLKDAGLVGDDGSGNLTSLAVTYDGTTKDSVTLGGVGATAPVALHNVADGVLSATSKDAVNGSQLFATNTRVGDLEDSLGKGGVIDPVTGESLAVVYDSNVKDTVTLAGTTGTTLSNVKAGVADMDAVNVSQLKDSGLIDPSTGKSIAAVTYDRNADGTPNYGTVTLGNGAGPTQIKNVATGVDDLDAVNVKQLNTGLSDLEDRMSGGNLRFVKVNADPLTGTPAVASGALAVAIGSDARATSANSLALGSGARVTGAGSVAIGYNSVANQNNVVSVGDVGRERKIVNVADGDVAFQSTDAVNGGQLYAALNTLSTSVTSKTQQAIDTFSSELDKKTKAAIDEVSARSMQPMDVSDPLVAIEGLQGNNVASLNGADPTKATAAAIGSSTAASGANAVAVGLQSGAGSNNSVAIGSFAQTGAGQDYSVAVGSNVQTNGTQAVALGANAQANGEYALAVGNNGAQAIGDGSIAVGNAANVRAGATNAVAIGTGANVARSVEGAMALGPNATAGAANSIALGANAFSDRANALSVGRAGAERQIVNVAAGTQTTDAVNVGQLKGVTDSLGGGSTVGADGKVTNPTYSLADPADASKSVAYDNVGDALSNLDGRTATNTQNITVINKQLADSGLVDPVTGQSIAAVTYDRNPDGTPNMGSVTLGGAGATAPVALKNVADGTDRHDAINLGQLQDAGLVAPVDPSNPGAGLTSLAVAYDGVAKDVVTLAGAGGTTLSNVKAGVADMDAVNVSQLKDSGLIDPSTGKSIAAVTYDRNPDGTPNYGSVTLGNGTGSTQLKNVADATDDGDALNLGQLKDAGLVGDDGSGNLTSMAVTYDGTAKDSVTLGGAGATTPVALHNVADGVLAADSKDAVNGSQLFATNQNLGDLKDSLEKGGVIDPTTGESLAVVYDSAAKNSVTLGNAGVPVAIHNVAAGAVNATSHDAVNGSQLFTVSQSVADKIGGGAGVGADGSLTDPTYSVGGQDYHNVGDALGALDKNSGGNPLAVAYDSAAKDTVTLGGAGATTPVALKNVADAKDDGDALNLGQLKNAGLVGDDGAGNLTSMAVTYDGAARDKVTLAGVDGTTLSNVKAGVADMDAVNVSQLKDAGLIDPSTGKPIAAVTYDSAAKDSVTLGGAGATTPVALKNVADAKDDGDALNLGQLKNAGLVGDDGAGNLTSMAVTYDGAAKDTVTLGGTGATAPVALKNVADGTDRHDAINVGQLQDAGLVAPVDPTNPGAGLASLAVTYGKHADGSANFDQVTLAGANGTTISNVKAGAVSATSTDAINGAQLHGVSQSVAKSLGGGASVDADGNVTNPSYKVSDKTFDNVGDAIENISNSLVHGSIGLVQQDDTTRDITVAKDTDGTTVNFAGTAGNRVLTGVAAGAVSATSVDAVNGSQLHGTAQSVADVIGGGTTVDADGKLADTAIDVNGTKYKTVADAVQAAAAYGATDSLAVRYDLNRDGTPNYGSVTLGGTGAAPVRLTNVADGASQYDAVNFGQLSELSDRIGGLDDRVGDLEQRPPGSGGPGNGGSGNDYFAGTDVGSGSTTPANAGAGTGNTAAGSGATIGTGANNATVIGSNAGASQSNGVAIGSGAKSAAEGATAIGSGSNASGNQSVAIGSGANASGSNSVALGAGSTAYSDDTVSVGSIDRTRTISNVSDGVNATDVATKGQLDRAMGGMQGQVNDLSRNAYSGIAAATALTMIPGVDPGKTISFGIGGATYKGYQAVAFGGEARITQNLKMKAGVGMSSGGNTVGVGASYQW
ncbi:YadA-like family protein, partial [Burkholderia cenocepacia]|uniref:YadA-like family protein n=1 Tax=Burkholderia cenocepacia TaxID=95486 RepID=UPI001CF14B9D